MTVKCPICGLATTEGIVNLHLDRGCPKKHIESSESPPKKPKIPAGSTDYGVARELEDLPTGQVTQHDNRSLTKSQNKLSSTRTEADSPGSARTVDVTEGNSIKARAASGQSTTLSQPLAEVLRPRSLEDFVGQPHLLGPNGVLRKMIEANRLPSIILWGPPGVGKTSFARLLARVYNARFVELSATAAGASDVRKLAEDARNEFRLLKRRTILFLDEIHRFSRSQQDSLLPSVENGELTLVGATTENPSFKLSSALISRCRVLVLNRLEESEICVLLARGLKQLNMTLPTEVLNAITSNAAGDGRTAINMLEVALNFPDAGLETIKQAIRHTAIYDQSGDMHYDLISAFHKAVRGSDADAALYYMSRMLENGEDPLYLTRRMIRIASEDIGLADDSCLPFAVATHTAAQQIGMPEADVLLAHCTVKLARAPKNVEVYQAYQQLKADLRTDPSLATAPVPLHLRNAPTQLMKNNGYGKGYKYNPEYLGAVHQEYLPEAAKKRKWLGEWKPSKTDADAGRAGENGTAA